MNQTLPIIADPAQARRGHIATVARELVKEAKAAATDRQLVRLATAVLHGDLTGLPATNAPLYTETEWRDEAAFVVDNDTAVGTDFALMVGREAASDLYEAYCWKQERFNPNLDPDDFDTWLDSNGGAASFLRVTEGMS